jgi:hypothetical protein
MADLPADEDSTLDGGISISSRVARARYYQWRSKHEAYLARFYLSRVLSKQAKPHDAQLGIAYQQASADWSNVARLTVGAILKSASACPVSLDEIVEVLGDLCKYARWQIDEGANHHPTLPSAEAEARSLLHRLKGEANG